MALVLAEYFSEVVASDVAKRDGFTLLLDKSGPSAIGIPAVVYASPATDITEEVMALINKDRPAVTPTPVTAAAPAATTDAPKITVPGIK